MPSGTYLEGSAQTSDGRVWFLDGLGNLLRGTANSTSTTVAYTFPGMNLATYISTSGLNLAYIDYGLVNSAKSVQRLTTDNGGVQSFTSVTLPSPDAYGTGTAFGHGDVVYALTTDYSSVTSLYRWLPGESPYKMSLTQTKAGRGMAIVVAPEPASMFALFGGIAAIALRRRRPQ